MMKKYMVLAALVSFTFISFFIYGAFFRNSQGNRYEIPTTKGMNVLSSSFCKLWFITENGEIYTRQSDWDDMTLKESNVVINKIIGEGSGIYALSSQDSYARPIYAIKIDGTVWQLVENAETNQYSLEQVNGIENCIKINNGEGHVMALTADGFVYTWGDNTYGQLGDGTNESRDTPKKIEALSDIIDISSSSHVCMALSKSGNVYTWGDNIEGQIGNSRYAESEAERSHNTVYHVEVLSDIIQIDSGRALSVALRRDGTVYHWGSRNSANFFCIPSPTVVEGLENIVQISAHDSHGLALSSSGEIWRWGWVFAVPGMGMHLPRKMAEFPNAVAIIAGWEDIVIAKNGEIWQGFTAEHNDPEAGIDFCYSGIFKCIFTKDDVQKYGIKLWSD